MTPAPAPLRRSLLLAFAGLFAAAVVLAVVAVVALQPPLERPRDAAVFIFGLLAAELAVLFGAGSYILRRNLVRPVDRLVEDVRRMTEGGTHRVGPMPSAELHEIGTSVNALAERLTRDQALLAENVASLERTNAELVEARGQVIRADRLASVGTLAAGIAHEIGNPLGALLGYVDVARSRALRDGQDPALLEAAREEARRIDRIVRSLLDYARPRGAGAETVDPAAVLVHVRELLSAQGRLDRVETLWRFAHGLPPVLIEPSRLEQVMVNLLLNALHAVEGVPSARVEVSASSEPGAWANLPRRREDDPEGVNYLHRRRAAAEAGPRGLDPILAAHRVVVITIADNGPGIDPAHLDRLFDPFFTTKAPGQGTGLGLAICAQLVQSMGGRIEAANREGGGALFTVRIPAAPEARAAEPEERRSGGGR